MQMKQQPRGPAAERVRSEAHPCADRRGSILVEFALVSLAFYLILAGTLEVGRMITSAQIVQNAARTMARELALLPLPATMTFEEALDCPTVEQRIFDRRLLAVPIGPMTHEDETRTWPTVNRLLLPLMVVTNVNGTAYLQYPGALVQSFTLGAPTVKVPKVISRGADGVEEIRWVDVIEEIGTGNLDPAYGPFSMASLGPELGLVALRVNCPYQAASMSAFQPVDVTEPNPVNEAILANDGGVTQLNAPGGTLMNTGSGGGIYAGQYGLGKFYALNKEVRPFRRLISGQAVFRREVFSAEGCP